MITMTHVGAAIITHQRLEILTSPKWGTSGTVALGILLDRDGKPQCWSLFWEWGGDWMGFGDGDQHDAEQLQGWEPDAIEAAVVAAVEACPRCEDDMEWFSDWANEARETLSTQETIMSLSITYYAPTDSMGDTSEADAAGFRNWAEQQLQAEFADANVSVSEQSSTRQVAINGAESPEQEEEIQNFVSRLWGRCPWDFN